jgi:hypothetical protein
MSGCSYDIGALSVNHVLLNDEPVLVQWFNCSGQMVKRYIDFTGRTRLESELKPFILMELDNFLYEHGLQSDITDQSERIRQLEALAEARGLM